jgi:hypothetical protein
MGYLHYPKQEDFEMVLKTITLICLCHKIELKNLIDFLHFIAADYKTNIDFNRFLTLDARKHIQLNINKFFNKNNADTNKIVPFFYEDCFLYVFYLLKQQMS